MSGDFRMTIGDALATIAIVLAVVVAVGGAIAYVAANISLDREELTHLYHDQDEPMMIWMESCVDDGLDPWESYVAYVTYLHGPPVLVKPWRQI